MVCSKVLSLQEIDVEKKLALCKAQIAYEDGRQPQFEVRTPILLGNLMDMMWQSNK